MYKIFPNTLFVGQSYQYLPTCHSTNDIATGMVLKSRVSEGLVVATSYQSAGRGQRGNSWETAPDQNLTFSLVLQPDFLKAYEQFQLNIAISLGIVDCLSELLGRGFAIKWPNDIYIQGKKIGGILIENILKAEFIGHAIIGIGININQRTFSIPTATSLASLSFKQYELTPILESLLEHIEMRYLQLKGNRVEPLKQAYLQRLYWFQETRIFENRKPGEHIEQFEGDIIGVDAAGKLAIASKDRGILYFEFKEVRFVK